MDGTLEVPGIEIAGMAELQLSVNNLADEQRRTRQAMEDARQAAPHFVRSQVSFANTGTSGFAMEIFGPEIGRFWLVRRIMVGAAAWDATAGGTLVAFITISDALTISTGGTGFSPTPDVLAVAATLPSVQTFSNEQAVMQQGENLVFQINGTTTANTTYVAAVQYVDYPVKVGSKAVFTA